MLCDNLKRSIGTKRNDLLALAHGDYVTFVDDDDQVADDYVRSLLGALGSDVTTFDVEVTLNGGEPFPMKLSKDYVSENRDGLWLRIPNHLMCTRRELAVQTGFPDLGVGEDADYAKRLHPLLRSETRIARTLYYYQYSDAVTLTQLRRS
ncbi:glycosyltransferase [Mycolicibacterium sp. CR10]|uniref:glycosyltransferase n=1 Tax=Mycolicibacterium sp. CR10 TaxID=2562314 RepID=UPI00197BE8B9|nr:glycosyltransferase [Mycolicibacterium sp. CR10]